MKQLLLPGKCMFQIIKKLSKGWLHSLYNMHALLPTSFDRYKAAYIGSWWNDFDWKPTKKYYIKMTFHVMWSAESKQIGLIEYIQGMFLWMKLIIRSFRKGIERQVSGNPRWRFMHSQWIALACQIWWSCLETTVLLKPIFCCHLNDRIFGN